MYKEKQFENQFFIYEPKCKKKYILGYLDWSDLAYILLSSYPLTHIQVHVK